jgi:hypothetical protein
MSRRKLAKWAVEFEVSPDWIKGRLQHHRRAGKEDDRGHPPPPMGDQGEGGQEPKEAEPATAGHGPQPDPVPITSQCSRFAFTL